MLCVHAFHSTELTSKSPSWSGRPPIAALNSFQRQEQSQTEPQFLSLSFVTFSLKNPHPGKLLNSAALTRHGWGRRGEGRGGEGSEAALCPDAPSSSLYVLTEVSSADVYWMLITCQSLSNGGDAKLKKTSSPASKTHSDGVSRHVRIHTLTEIGKIKSKKALKYQRDCLREKSGGTL